MRQALHDLVGKARGLPVYQLLGGAHRHYTLGHAANILQPVMPPLF